MNHPTIQRSAHVVEGREESMNSITREEIPEVEESLLMKKILIKLEKEANELV